VDGEIHLHQSQPLFPALYANTTLHALLEMTRADWDALVSGGSLAIHFSKWYDVDISFLGIVPLNGNKAKKRDEEVF